MTRRAENAPFEIGSALEARGDELARLIVGETGNDIRTQARGEARLAAPRVS